MRSVRSVSAPSTAVGCLEVLLNELMELLGNVLRSGDEDAEEVSEQAGACDGAPDISSSPISISKARSERLEHCRSMSPSLSSPNAVSALDGENMPHICLNNTHDERERESTAAMCATWENGGRAEGRCGMGWMRGQCGFSLTRDLFQR